MLQLDSKHTIEIKSKEAWLRARRRTVGGDVVEKGRCFHEEELRGLGLHVARKVDQNLRDLFQLKAVQRRVAVLSGYRCCRAKQTKVSFKHKHTHTKHTH